MPAPAGVNEARGNPGRRPKGESQSAPLLSDDALQRPPEWLSPDGAGIWARLAPDLAQMRLLSRPDALTFGRYCQLYAQWLKVMAEVETTGMVVQTVSEHVTMDRLSKHFQAQLLLEKRLVDLEDRFGLNPANRQRIFAQRAAGAGSGQGALPLGDQSEPGSPAKSAPLQGPVGMLN
jgi:P27 family predicted phage terminase small subunit